MLTGQTRDRSLDAPEFSSIFEAAARVRVPLDLHPDVPLLAQRHA